MMRVARAHRYSLSLIAAPASWGIATVISKRAVDEIEPLTLLPIELAVSTAVLGVAVRVTCDKVSWSPELRRLGLLGVVNPGLSYALSLAGLARITASMSVLLWALEPLLILALAFWILKDRVSVPFAVCAATALAGAVLVVFQPGSEATAAGVALTIAGVAACAVYTVLSSRFLIAASSLSVVFVQQVAAFVFSLVLLGGSVVVADPRSIWGVSGTAWLSALGAGILYYAVAFWFYVTGLRGVRPAFAGMFLNLIPMFGLAASYLFLDERLTGRQWFGAALILAAVVTIARLQTPAPQRQSHEAVL
jgi:drug/metabolite transporter (DMT)-like permease